MDQILQYKKLTEEITQCQICPQGKTGMCMVGEGSLTPRVVFVGEAPGKKEAATGRPFIGRSGKLLRTLIKKINLSEQEIYITSVVKYLPLSRTPKISDITHGKVHLSKQLELLHPNIVVLLGKVAMNATLLPPVSILRDHGTIRHVNGQIYFLTVHPAAALRFRKYLKILQDDFNILQEFVAK